VSFSLERQVQAPAVCLLPRTLRRDARRDESACVDDESRGTLGDQHPGYDRKRVEYGKITRLKSVFAEDLSRVDP
jgi:hypothetical protein